MIGLVWICIVCFVLDEVNAYTSDRIDTTSCAVKWVAVHDVFSLGAKFQFEINDLDQCREACIRKIPGCIAIDVHGHFNHCFTHTQSLANLEKERKPYKGYTQLLLTKACVSSTPVLTTKTNGNTLPSFTQTVGSKPQGFTETVDGKPRTTTETDKDILENISEDFAECSTEAPTTRTTERSWTDALSSTTGAYELSTIDILASTVQAADEISPTVSSDEPISLPVSQTDCLDLFDEWEEYKDTRTSRAKLYSEVGGGIEACKRACVEKIAGCVAVEDHLSSNCWYHDKYIDVSKYRKTRQGYTLYVRLGGCESAKSIQQSNSLLHLQLDLFG